MAIPENPPNSDDSPEQGSLPGGNRRGWVSRRLLPGGVEPDPRFTLANERTFLAWIRTALALLAGGIAVEAFTADIFVPELRKSLAVLMLLLAMTIAGASSVRWIQIERAMRTNRPLPISPLAPMLSIGAALVAVVVVVFVVLRPI